MNRIRASSPLALLFSIFALGCGDILPGSEMPVQPESLDARGIVPGRASIVEITASHTAGEHRFSLSDGEIPHGWTTFRFANASPSDHFVLVYRAPQAAIDAAENAGRSLVDHWRETVTVPFQEEFDPFVSGGIGYEEFVGNLVGAISGTAPWFFDPGAPAVGGPGLTAAGRTSETTVLLAPGTYVLECYVKDGSEQFHSFNGMLAMLIVTDERSGAAEPDATVGVSLSSTAGLEVLDEAMPGRHTFAIEFVDQTTYEHLQGHNAHLVRLDRTDENLLNALADWMDWRQKGALAVRAPEGAELLGGTMEMAGPGIAYYTVNLTPGDYAWIAEVPDPAGKNMLKTFSVPAGRGPGH